MRINTNIMALNAQNKLSMNQGKVENSIQKLSSGLRINGAADDAAGLAISEKMRAQIRGLDQAASNAQDGISLLQTAEGALQQTTDILQRMRELVIKAQNSGVLTEEDKTSISNELSVLRDEIDRIGESTTFNGKKLLNGDLGVKLDADATNTVSVAGLHVDVSNAIAGKEYTVEVDDTNKKITVKVGTEELDSVTFASGTVSGRISFEGKVDDEDCKIVMSFDEMGIGALKTAVGSDNKITTEAATVSTKADFKIGANDFKEDTLSFGIGDMTAKGLSKDGKAFTIDISDREKSDATLKALDFAIEHVSAQRATIGTMQNRMEFAISNLSTSSENLSAAESRIRDVDMAEEMVNYTKTSILNQSAMAMLAQANQQPQSILSLLG